MQHDQRGAEQAEADGEQADHAAGAERDPHRRSRRRSRSRAAAATRTLARVASHMPTYADEGARTRRRPRRRSTGRSGSRRRVGRAAGTAGRRASTTKTASVRNCRFRYADGALLDRPGDLLHLRGALVGGEHALRSATAKPSATSAIAATIDDVGEVARRSDRACSPPAARVSPDMRPPVDDVATATGAGRRVQPVDCVRGRRIPRGPAQVSRDGLSRGAAGAQRRPPS